MGAVEKAPAVESAPAMRKLAHGSSDSLVADGP